MNLLNIHTKRIEKLEASFDVSQKYPCPALGSKIQVHGETLTVISTRPNIIEDDLTQPMRVWHVECEQR